MLVALACLIICWQNRSNRPAICKRPCALQ